MNPPSSAIWPRRLSVLMVEDNRLDAELNEARLMMLDCDVDLTLVDTEAAFRTQLASKRFDVILSDFMLPTFSGAEALSIARAEAPDTPFIFVSGVLGEEHAVEMLKQGATDYVIKQRLQRLPMTVRRAVTESDERRNRIRAESALREYETGFRLLVNALKDYAVISLDRHGRILSWNGAAERLLGFRADDVVGKSAGRLFANDESGEREVMHSIGIAEHQDSHVRETWMRGRDGEEFFASIVTTAIRNDAGELIGFSKIIRDTTEARRAADALCTAKEEAEAANAAKDRFLAMLSHELRTPLTPILAATSFIEQRGDLPPKLAELLPLIRRNIELESRLIDDLLDLTSIRHDKMSLQLRPLDFHESLQPILAGAQVDADDKRHHLEIKLNADSSRINVDGDSARLQQIVSNLLRNAIKFTPPGGHITVETFNPDERTIALRVTDSGIGITDVALPRIFSAFEQADGTINRQFGGLGLGLAIAHALAVKHGGTLVAESEGEGLGASFTLTLPLTERLDERAAKPVESQSAANRSLNILLVEDNEDTTLAMTTLLTLSGHTVESAANVEEANEKSASARFDLLISDIGLPDGDGTEVVKVFVTHQQNAPSIAMTGYGMDDDVKRCRQAGFTAHVTKPVGFDRLSSLIQSLTLQGP